MAESSSKSIRTEVVAGALTAIVVAIGGAIWAWVPSVWQWLATAWASVTTHLSRTASVPTWLLYLLYATAGTWVFVIGVIAYSVLARKERPATYLDYREDRFFGAIWRWVYVGGRPDKTWAFCPSCDTVLVYSERMNYGDWETTLHCETCAHTVLSQPCDRHDLVAKVERQIDRKVRSGEWKACIPARPHKPSE